MKKLLFAFIIMLFGTITNAQETMCDSIMKQMDFEIETAKKNSNDPSIISYLEQAKAALKKQFCEDGNFSGAGGTQGNTTDGNEHSNPSINNDYIKTKPYKGAPFYGKHKISVKVISNTEEGSFTTNYSYYINKEGSLILLDKECLQNAGMSMMPNTDGGTFQYWAMRNDGISTVFALSDKGEKIAVTTYNKNALIEPQKNSKPILKNLNQSKTIAGNLCKAYQVIYKEPDAPKMILWITTKPMQLQHDVLPFTTMFMADKFGLANFKNHGILELDMKHGSETAFLTVTAIIPANITVAFNGYTEFFMEY